MVVLLPLLLLLTCKITKGGEWLAAQAQPAMLQHRLHHHFAIAHTDFPLCDAFKHCMCQVVVMTGCALVWQGCPISKSQVALACMANQGQLVSMIINRCTDDFEA